MFDLSVLLSFPNSYHFWCLYIYEGEIKKQKKMELNIAIDLWK